MALIAGLENRREALSQVVLRLVDERGLEGVTVRAVAAAAGVSIGTVQHYFPTKDAMLLHAHGLASTAVGARADAAADGALGPVDTLRAIVAAILPTDDESARVVRVFVAFETRALHSPILAERVRSDTAELHGAFAEMLRAAGVPDADREAVGLLALVGGLCQPLLLGICTPREAAAIVDAHLGRVVPPDGTPS